MLRHSNNFLINPLTVIFILLAFIFNKFNFLLLHYLVALIHELFHYITAKFLNVEVEEITFLPIGFYLKINGLEDYSFIKQLLVLISGPLSFFFSFLVLRILYNLDLISIYGYKEGLISNNFILIFNLLPIYPLDGSKIIELLLTPFFNEYKLRVIRIILSLLTLVIASSYLLSLGEFIVMIFLFITTIVSLVKLKKDYILYLLSRMTKKNKRKIKMNSKKEIYRLKDNYFLENNKILNEKEIISQIVFSSKLKDEMGKKWEKY